RRDAQHHSDQAHTVAPEFQKRNRRDRDNQSNRTATNISHPEKRKQSGQQGRFEDFAQLRSEYRYDRNRQEVGGYQRMLVREYEAGSFVGKALTQDIERQ